jgi:hypothetical protein
METIRSNKPQEDFVTAFLSCSVRPEDRPLVDGIADKVLWPLGFRCLTVGRNISLPDQPDDAMRDIMDKVDCLVGVATVRLDATERTSPNRTLRFASAYVLQETAMAHQRRLPFLIFKTPEVTLQGVTAKNLYIEVAPTMPNGRPRFHARKDLVLSSLEDLRKRAIENRSARRRDELVAGLGKLSSLAVGTYAVGSFLDWLSRPNCFGSFYYRAVECRDCKHKAACKVEKTRLNSQT